MWYCSPTRFLVATISRSRRVMIAKTVATPTEKILQNIDGENVLGCVVFWEDSHVLLVFQGVKWQMSWKPVILFRFLMNHIKTMRMGQEPLHERTWCDLGKGLSRSQRIRKHSWRCIFSILIPSTIWPWMTYWWQQGHRLGSLILTIVFGEGTRGPMQVPNAVLRTVSVRVGRLPDCWTISNYNES